MACPEREHIGSSIDIRGALRRALFGVACKRGVPIMASRLSVFPFCPTIGRVSDEPLALSSFELQPPGRFNLSSRIPGEPPIHHLEAPSPNAAPDHDIGGNRLQSLRCAQQPERVGM